MTANKFSDDTQREPLQFMLQKAMDVCEETSITSNDCYLVNFILEFPECHDNDPNILPRFIDNLLQDIIKTYNSLPDAIRSPVTPDLDLVWKGLSMSGNMSFYYVSLIISSGCIKGHGSRYEWYQQHIGDPAITLTTSNPVPGWDNDYLRQKIQMHWHALNTKKQSTYSKVANVKFDGDPIYVRNSSDKIKKLTKNMITFLSLAHIRRRQYDYSEVGYSTKMR